MDVLDLLLDPWRSGIGRRALFEVVLLGGFCGAMGFWVVSFRRSGGGSMSRAARPTSRKRSALASTSR